MSTRYLGYPEDEIRFLSSVFMGGSPVDFLSWVEGTCTNKTSIRSDSLK